MPNSDSIKYTEDDLLISKIQCVLSGLSYKDSVRILKKTKQDLKLVCFNALKPDDYIEINKAIKSELGIK